VTKGTQKIILIIIVFFRGGGAAFCLQGIFTFLKSV
jgi:hypothetical protein